VKQEPEAIVSNDPELNFKDLKKYLNSNLVIQPLILILDNVIDPRNLGACIRCAAVAGVDAMIINKHQCAPLNAVAHKVSVGGAEVIKLFHVTNLINCLKFLNEKNINIYGLSEHADESYHECNFKFATALIMGAEESGIREKTLERCDHKINLSGNKLFKSFNVSVATGIILSEANRQRQNR
jgi:23S rRNA (guanosine2251-2'-O)-methyltransferase